MTTIRFLVTLEEVPGKGWLADAPELLATAQGSTREEALANLRALLERYPETVDEFLERARNRKDRRLELVSA